MTTKTPEQIEIDTLRVHTAELLADLKAAKTSAKQLGEQITTLTGERDVALAQVRAITISQPVQAMAERLSTLPDVWTAEIARRGWQFTHDGARVVLRDADGKPVLIGTEQREAAFTEADLREACLEQWKPAAEHHESVKRFAHITLVHTTSGGGALHGAAATMQAKPATPAAPQRGGLR